MLRLSGSWHGKDSGLSYLLTVQCGRGGSAPRAPLASLMATDLIFQDASPFTCVSQQGREEAGKE